MMFPGWSAMPPDIQAAILIRLAAGFAGCGLAAGIHFTVKLIEYLGGRKKKGGDACGQPGAKQQ